jgi:pimeloyl-ACP methyl ester carboxylesterase
MDFIRSALGEQRITYVGYSYGTFLGATYADMFPTRVRAAVLDGAIDPEVDMVQTSVEQAVGFQRAFDNFLASCTSPSSCALRNDGDPRAAYDRLEAEVEANPIKVGSRSVGPGVLEMGVAAALYSQRLWPTLANALHAALAGDGAPVLSLMDALTQRQADGSYSPLFSAFYATSCLDRPAPTDPTVWDKAAAQAAAEAPDFGASNVYGGLVCAYWKVPPVDSERAIHAAGAPPILVIGTTDDPATPYKWAQALASELDKGVLLTRVGEGHTSSGSSNGCVTAAVNAYLINETIPTNRSC